MHWQSRRPKGNGASLGVRITASQFLRSFVLFPSFPFHVHIIHSCSLFGKASVADTFEEDVLGEMGFSRDHAATVTPSARSLPRRGGHAHVWARDVPRAEAPGTYDVLRLDQRGFDMIDVGIYLPKLFLLFFGPLSQLLQLGLLGIGQPARVLQLLARRCIGVVIAQAMKIRG